MTLRKIAKPLLALVDARFGRADLHLDALDPAAR